METQNLFEDINGSFSVATIPRPPTTKFWDPRLTLDLAIGVDDLDTILERYALTKGQFNNLSDLPAFKRDLAEVMRDVREKGVPFKTKAKIQAEVYLELIDKMVFDENVPAGVRLDAIKSVVKWGDLEPTNLKDDGAISNAVNIQINF